MLLLLLYCKSELNPMCTLFIKSQTKSKVDLPAKTLENFNTRQKCPKHLTSQ